MVLPPWLLVCCIDEKPSGIQAIQNIAPDVLPLMINVQRLIKHLRSYQPFLDKYSARVKLSGTLMLQDNLPLALMLVRSL